jgi:hypothetical protein
MLEYSRRLAGKDRKATRDAEQRKVEQKREDSGLAIPKAWP